jgi:hypothetical protein
LVSKSRKFWGDVFCAWAVATLLSGIPSTLYSWATGRDVFEATRAAGTMLLSEKSSSFALFLAAAVVHSSVSLFWSIVLIYILPDKRVILYSVIGAIVIGVFDLRIIGPLFPEIIRLPFWPQMADHVFWGASVGTVHFIRNKTPNKDVQATPNSDAPDV